MQLPENHWILNRRFQIFISTYSAWILAISAVAQYALYRTPARPDPSPPAAASPPDEAGLTATNRPDDNLEKDKPPTVISNQQ